MSEVNGQMGADNSSYSTHPLDSFIPIVILPARLLSSLHLPPPRSSPLALPLFLTVHRSQFVWAFVLQTVGNTDCCAVFLPNISLPSSTSFVFSLSMSAQEISLRAHRAFLTFQTGGAGLQVNKWLKLHGIISLSIFFGNFLSL